MTNSIVFFSSLSNDDLWPKHVATEYILFNNNNSNTTTNKNNKYNNNNNTPGYTLLFLFNLYSSTY